MTDPLRLPKRVTIYEVGPRDGLQNESTILDTDVKAELIRKLFDAGLPAVEVTSFVRPDLIPALADGGDLVAQLGDLVQQHRAPALVPNMRGLERAMAAGIREIAVFASATESFAKANLNSTVEQSLQVFGQVVREAKAAGLSVRGYISMCFGDPWEGRVEPQQVTRVAMALAEAGVDEISIGDTIGVATPNQVIDLLDALTSHDIGVDRLAVHFHDTYGQALSNTITAIMHGVTTVDASVAGLGGCPFAGSATGNLATEDLVWQLNGMGVHTGVDLERLVDISWWLAEVAGLQPRSKTAIALRKSRGGAS